MAAIDYAEAAHLLRRMGFGGSPSQINDLVNRGSREAAVAHLLDYGQVDNRTMEDVLARVFDFDDPTDGGKFNQNEVKRWWFTRMVFSNRPFEEKMTLFWHNFFATSVDKVNIILMYNQNQMLRANALERFDTLLLKVAQDPAMILWLDNNTNVLGRPNENFGRELMELFSTGVVDFVTGEPNYTEDDVKEVARAFTGWNFVRDNPRTDPFNFRFVINPNQHDNGLKTIFGSTANFSGQDVVDILCDKRATGRRIAAQLMDFFVYPLTGSNRDKNVVDDFADVYMSSNHSIKELVRAIFTSDEFFSERARYSLVKTPPDYIVGSIRMLGAKYEPALDERRRDNTLLVASTQFGMDLLEPPDVFGWDLNLGWINTAAMLSRYNFANSFITQRNANTTGVYVSIDDLRQHTKSNPKKTVKALLKVLGPVDVDSATIKRLKGYLETNDQGGTVEWTVTDQNIDKKIRGLVHQIMSLPEYQLS